MVAYCTTEKVYNLNRTPKPITYCELPPKEIELIIHNNTPWTFLKTLDQMKTTLLLLHPYQLGLPKIRVFCESWQFDKTSPKKQNVETYASKSHSPENSLLQDLPTPSDFQNSIFTTSTFAPFTNVDKVGSWMSSKCNRCIIISSNPILPNYVTQHPPVHHPLQLCYDYSIVDEPSQGSHLHNYFHLTLPI